MRISSCVAVVAALLASQARAADQALIDAAKKEGKVVWYTTLIVDQFVRPAVAAFERKYGVKVEYVRMDPNDIALRISNEGRAGQMRSDISDGFGMPQLVRAGYVDSWLPDHVKKWPQQYFDPKGFWTSTNFFVLAPGFNTDVIKKGTEPRGYEALLDPRLKGKMAWSSRASASSAVGFVGGVLSEMGEQKGMDYLRKLAGQGIINVDGSARQVLDQVIAGEFPMALQMFNHHSVISQGKGAPVDWVRFEPAMVVLAVFQLTAKGSSPNAARLLLDFFTSEEGQKLFREADYMPVDAAVPPREPSLKPEIGGFKATYYTPDQIDDGTPKWTEVYKQLFR